MIDLRSDTVTQPGAQMRAAMIEAPLGDDVFGDDPTVNQLQTELALRLGFEAGLYCATGTQSNLCGLMAHCQRGEEYIVGMEAHTYGWEGGGAAVLGSIQPQPLDNAADGSIPLARIRTAIKPDDPHFAMTRLLALENTISGRVLPQEYVTQATALAKEHGLNTHLDGARFFNAVMASRLDGETLNQTERRLATGFDSISLCLSKGLGAPAGAVLLGSSVFIQRAKRVRKMLGGGMRQAGVIAAAGRWALSNHVERLAHDHANAKRLAQAFDGLPGFKVVPVQTNIVFVECSPELVKDMLAYLRKNHILATGLYKLRLVTHLDVSQAQIDQAVQVIKGFAPC
jgi:threonine aldolase